jgi:hypothetical protein
VRAKKHKAVVEVMTPKQPDRVVPRGVSGGLGDYDFFPGFQGEAFPGRAATVVWAGTAAVFFCFGLRASLLLRC